MTTMTKRPASRKLKRIKARVWTPARAASIIPFTFKFSASGGFTAWEVLFLGEDQADGRRRGSFSSSINSGFNLVVTIKVWGGDYAINYSCEGPPGTVRNGDPTPPITGHTTSDLPKTIRITIPF